jgi:hypothetical protein
LFVGGLLALTNLIKLMEINDMKELNLNDICHVNGGAVIVIPLAYKVFVAGFTAGSGLVIAAYKML